VNEEDDLRRYLARRDATTYVPEPERRDDPGIISQILGRYFNAAQGGDLEMRRMADEARGVEIPYEPGQPSIASRDPSYLERALDMLPEGGERAVRRFLRSPIPSTIGRVGSYMASPEALADLETGGIGRAAGIIAKTASNLPMSRASRMARARELGFDVDRQMYHGNPDWRAIDDAGEFEARGRPIYLTSNRRVAKGYSEGYTSDYQNAVEGVRGFYVNPGRTLSVPFSANWWDQLPADRIRNAVEEAEVAQFDEIVSDLARKRGSSELSTEDLANIARSLGYDSFEAVNIIDPKTAIDYRQALRNVSTVRGVFDPARLRYTNAAFDPAMRESANLLAGTAGAMIGGSAVARALKEENKREER